MVVVGRDWRSGIMTRVITPWEMIITLRLLAFFLVDGTQPCHDVSVDSHHCYSKDKIQAISLHLQKHCLLVFRTQVTECIQRKQSAHSTRAFKVKAEAQKAFASTLPPLRLSQSGFSTCCTTMQRDRWSRLPVKTTTASQLTSSLPVRGSAQVCH